jgi:hypothetical protein
MALFKSIIIAILFIALVQEAYTSPVGTYTNKTDVNGQSVLKLATKLKSELLETIGNAIINLECKTPSCSQWTEWTTCDPKLDTFGVTSRGRECKVGQHKCPGYRSDKEEQFEVCQVENQ